MNKRRLAELRAEADKSEARGTLMKLFDPGSFIELDPFVSTDSVITASGQVAGRQVFAFAQNREEEHGAVTAAHTRKLKKLYRLAEETGVPIIGFFDSFGGKISDGMVTVDGYADWLTAINRLSGVVPQIAVINGPCVGAAAVIAAASDLILLTQEGEWALTPPFLKEAGGFLEYESFRNRAHLTASSMDETIAQLQTLLSYLPSNNLTEAAATSYLEPEQPVFLKLCEGDILPSVCDKDSVLTLQRQFGECVQTSFARIAGRSVGVIVTAKQTLCVNGMGKAARFVRFCDAFHIPVITLADVTGVCSQEDDAASLTAAAQLCHAYAEATTPKVSVITGDAYGTLAVALAGRGVASDWTVAWEDAALSPMSPVAAVELLFREQLKEAQDVAEKRRQLADVYRRDNASAFAAMNAGTVDTVIRPEETRQALQKILDLLQTKRVATKPKKHSNIPL